MFAIQTINTGIAGVTDFINGTLVVAKGTGQTLGTSVLNLGTGNGVGVLAGDLVWVEGETGGPFVVLSRTDDSATLDATLSTSASGVRYQIRRGGVGYSAVEFVNQDNHVQSTWYVGYERGSFWPS